MVRPIQLRANAEDAAFMIAQAKASAERHGESRMPVAIVAGVGHMVHHAAPDQIVLAVDGVRMPHLEPARQVA